MSQNHLPWPTNHAHPGRVGRFGCYKPRSSAALRSLNDTLDTLRPPASSVLASSQYRGQNLLLTMNYPPCQSRLVGFSIKGLDKIGPSDRDPTTKQDRNCSKEGPNMVDRKVITVAIVAGILLAVLPARAQDFPLPRPPMLAEPAEAAGFADVQPVRVGSSGEAPSPLVARECESQRDCRRATDVEPGSEVQPRLGPGDGGTMCPGPALARGPGGCIRRDGGCEDQFKRRFA